ncbi:nuclease-related domain-containing protein [Limnohabitans sp. TEGF004]|jgi:hypothetical protein|uniref:nuclease-related domain-containing protein n=1 Tax=Limnohabitans sp. TEGF004 TaxID=2986281 RepID=UPI0023778D24|nr:nuclease-related domain-containing protein [Limnohabitans sp. TEGF004]BDU55730.1 hypothetical protein LTEGF4_14110 [Limnohabitans sp. TEGF004]
MTSKLYLVIALALAISYALGRFHARYRTSTFQNRGEALVSRELQSNFNGPDYHLLNHITLKLKDGTTQIDHILVSRFGVFVIETKHYNGWIFANAKQATWTQVLYRQKFKFQNPIFQNMRHVEAVKNILDFLPSSCVQSLVVFTGNAKFKTDIPPGVFTASELIKYLRNHVDEAMSVNRLQFCVGRIETARLAVSREIDLEHVKNLEHRHSGKN